MMLFPADVHRNAIDGVGTITMRISQAGPYVVQPAHLGYRAEDARTIAKRKLIAGDAQVQAVMKLHHPPRTYAFMVASSPTASWPGRMVYSPTEAGTMKVSA